MWWISFEFGQTEAGGYAVVAATAAVRAARVRFAAIALGDALLKRIAGGAARAQADRIAAVQFADGRHSARIRYARIRRWLTAAGRVGCVAGRTATGGDVVEHLAQSVRAAIARRLAVTVHAGLVTLAFAVVAAADHRQTLDVGVADEPGRTTARDAMVDGHTFGVLAARVLVARTDAAPVEAVAQQMRRTVDVVVADVGGVVENWNGGYD